MGDLTGTGLQSGLKNTPCEMAGGVWEHLVVTEPQRRGRYKLRFAGAAGVAWETFLTHEQATVTEEAGPLQTSSANAAK